jgi:hypothetical protein
MNDGEVVEIASRDYWIKIVAFLQQNWALIDPHESGVVVWFFGDTSGVFDEMTFSTEAKAVEALRRNGFRRYAEVPRSEEFVAKPGPPFHGRAHPNGRIYSSGRFWKHG